jgi:hypothetical protein
LFDDKYRQNLNEIFDDENKLREELKEKKEGKGKEENQDKRLDLVDFIYKPEVRETIKKIIAMDYKQLLEYRRVGMIMPQKISESATSREKLIELLRAEKVSEFNALRDRVGLEQIDLRDADLRGANLSEVNLSMANLSGANLSRVNLSRANLREVDLREADLSGAELSRGNNLVTDYQRAMVSGANFENVLTNDKDFLKYLKEKGAKNVPNYVTMARMEQ